MKQFKIYCSQQYFLSERIFGEHYQITSNCFDTLIQWNRFIHFTESRIDSNAYSLPQNRAIFVCQCLYYCCLPIGNCSSVAIKNSGAIAMFCLIWRFVYFPKFNSTNVQLLIKLLWFNTSLNADVSGIFRIYC